MNWKAVFFAGAMSSAALSHATSILIDDFSDGNITHNVDSSTFEAAALTGASVFDGDRATFIGQVTQDASQRSQLRVAGGRLAVSNDDGVSNTASLGYGSTGIGSNLAFQFNFASNLSLGSNNALRFDFLRTDLPLTITVDFYSNGITPAATYTKNVVGNQFNPFSVTVSSADLTSGTATWNNFDLMVVTFDTAVSGDFALDRVEAVPEPATMAAVAVGMAAMAARRRKKSK